MTNRFRLAVLLILMLPIGSAIAQAPSSSTPAFSAEEQAVIRRNSALNDLLPRDPVLVRNVLDAIAFASTGGARSNDGSKPRKPERPPNPKSNPDLENLGRASPEAAHDLFQLIKKAGQKRQSSSSK
jgi:hypothetical protein